jgi:hypothetical protein
VIVRVCIVHAGYGGIGLDMLTETRSDGEIRTPWDDICAPC